MQNTSIGAAIARWRTASALRLWLLIAYNVVSARRRLPATLWPARAAGGRCPA